MAETEDVLRLTLPEIVPPLRPQSLGKPFRPKIQIAVRVLLLMTIAASFQAVVPQSNAPPKPWRQKAFLIPWSPGQRFPKIDRGFVLFSRRVILGDSPNGAIYLRSLSEGTERWVAFKPNGASIIWINDVAIASSERIFTVGSLARATDGTPVNFMALSDMTGRVIKTIDMGTYEPELACLAGDGNLWTFGQDWSAEGSDLSYPMLRNYSGAGRLLASYLPSDSLPPAKLNFSTRLHRMGGAPGRIFLQCGSQSVGTYIGPVHTWVEIDLSDGAAHSWVVSPPAAGNITGLALLEKHQVYCSFRGLNTVFVRGFFHLDFRDSKVATWEPIKGMMEYNINSKSLPTTFLFGSDEASLVYAQIAPGKVIYSWIRP